MLAVRVWVLGITVAALLQIYTAIHQSASIYSNNKFQVKREYCGKYALIPGILTTFKLGVRLLPMGRKEVFVGIFVILVILGIVFGIKKAKDSKVKPLNIPTPVETQVLENKFNLTIPDDVEKTNLKVANGFEGIGVATRKFTNGVFTHVIIADLPDSLSGNYKAWLIKDDTNKISTGTLGLAKGGYLLEFTSNADYSDYKKVEVRLNDKVVLSGSF